MHTLMPTQTPVGRQPGVMALCQAGTTNMGLRCPHGPAGLCAAHETEITELFPLIYVKIPLAAQSPKEGGVPSRWVSYKMLAVNPDRQPSPDLPRRWGLAWPRAVASSGS